MPCFTFVLQKLTRSTHSHRETLETALTDERVADAEASAKELFADLSEKYVDTHSPWILGGDNPTLLDAHMLPFIVRLLDFERHDLVPPQLEQYAKRVQEMPQWQDVMHGRPTVWSPSMGHVHLLNPI